nr:EF-hand domain-containing family member C2-like [Parasteatoda tepidariorum]
MTILEKHIWYGYDVNQFKFFARAITEDPVEKLHRFVVCFFLEDNTLSIIILDNHHDSSLELPRFRRMKVTKPQSIHENSGRCFYRPLDMYVGNVIYVRGKPFELLEADDYTYDYMERNADVFPLSNVRLIMSNFQEWVPTKLQLIKSRFEEMDDSRIGTIDYNNFKEAIYAEIPEELKAKFPEHAVKTLARYYAEDRYIGLKLKDLASRVHAELCRKKFYDFENLKLAFSVYDQQKSNFLDPERIYYILRTTSLPISRDLLKSFIYKFPKTENKINYRDIVEAMNWMTSPSCFSNSEPYAIQINWERVQTEKDLSRIKYNCFLKDAVHS